MKNSTAYCRLVAEHMYDNPVLSMNGDYIAQDIHEDIVCSIAFTLNPHEHKTIIKNKLMIFNDIKDNELDKMLVMLVNNGSNQYNHKLLILPIYDVLKYFEQVKDNLSRFNNKCLNFRSYINTGLKKFKDIIPIHVFAINIAEIIIAIVSLPIVISMMFIVYILNAILITTSLCIVNLF